MIDWVPEVYSDYENEYDLPYDMPYSLKEVINSSTMKEVEKQVLNTP